MTGVWDEVVGQADAVAELAVAAEDPSAMTHAWLFTGPPGAARAFAAALQCPTLPSGEAPRRDRRVPRESASLAVAGAHGCGECPSCHTAMTGTHTDIREVVPEGLSIGVNEMRALVQLAARQPAVGRYQIVIITDADRLTEGASNALLKAVEEPSDQTVSQPPSGRGAGGWRCAARLQRRSRRCSRSATGSTPRRRNGPRRSVAATSAAPVTWPATRRPAAAASVC